MASAAGARPLPKFGEWDVNKTGGDQGFTMIFNKARNHKRTSGSAAGGSINGSAHGPAAPASGPPPPSQHAVHRDDAARRHGQVHGHSHGHGPGPSDNPAHVKIIESQGHSQPPHPVPGYYHNPPNNNPKPNPPKNRWLCCIYGSET